MLTREHLGGYIRGGDDATYFPALWEWLVREHGVRSMIDVGCGEGHALKFFRDQLGCTVYGIDGIAQEDPDIGAHDYTTGPWRRRAGDYYTTSSHSFDLVWCCEFVEHVEERYVPNFLATFALGELVMITHAEPGQQGHHHVNCRTSDYWVGAMAAIGYRLDTDLKFASREVARANTSQWNHFVRSGLAFRRNK